eukprot:TRINITY_DN4939_c0_g1_i1.p1 TRINITY_DN4939_c0_g1~~TRINITY_DN4939_c0_g1_i1.p1  ORF type:complete len:177 (-),score=48.75 TRINITY_DN4939_c0_g1_i1:93-623(-)
MEALERRREERERLAEERRKDMEDKKRERINASHIVNTIRYNAQKDLRVESHATSPLTASHVISTREYTLPVQSYNYFEKKAQRKQEEDELENYKSRWEERILSSVATEVVEEPSRVRNVKRDKFDARKWEREQELKRAIEEREKQLKQLQRQKELRRKHQHCPCHRPIRENGWIY